MAASRRPAAAFPVVVASAGAEGAFLLEPGGRPRHFAVAEGDEPVDDGTGAGDALAAGCLAALGDGASPPEALVRGQIFARRAISRPKRARYPPREQR